MILKTISKPSDEPLVPWLSDRIIFREVTKCILSKNSTSDKALRTLSPTIVAVVHATLRDRNIKTTDLIFNGSEFYIKQLIDITNLMRPVLLGAMYT